MKGNPWIMMGGDEGLGFGLDNIFLINFIEHDSYVHKVQSNVFCGKSSRDKILKLTSKIQIYEIKILMCTTRYTRLYPPPSFGPSIDCYDSTFQYRCCVQHWSYWF